MGIGLLKSKPSFGGFFLFGWVVQYLNRRQFDCSLEYTTFFWLGISAIPIIAYFLIPKGTPLHEVVHLPYYWLLVKTEESARPTGQKHFYGEDSRQYYLLFPPQETSKNKDRVIIYFHGGAWRYGRPELFTLVAERFTQKGFITVLPSCRRTPRFNYQDVRLDLNKMIVSIKRHFPERDIKFIVGGMSSGGNLAAHLFYNQKALINQGFSQQEFLGLVLLGAPLDLAAMPRNTHVSSFAGKPSSPLFSEANVQVHVQAEDQRAVLCIHGEQDGLVPIASARQFFAALDQIGSANAKRLHPPQASHLDVAGWVRKNSPFHQVIMDWLDDLG